MRPRTLGAGAGALCTAMLMTALMSATPALAQQKTAKECNDEWTANKASIQASGKTKKVFVAECRGTATTTAAPATPAAATPDATAKPAASGQKTAKECNDEWTANKASIQASGKTKKVFVAECRGIAAATPAAPATTPDATAKPAATGQKTAKECNDEWTANKASIQASGKTKKVFVAECRGIAATTAAPTAAPAAEKPASEKPVPTAAQPPSSTPPAPAATPAPAPRTAVAPAAPRTPTTPMTPMGAGEFMTEDAAKAHCPGDTVVWANLDSKIYHFNGTSDYGHTKIGAYMCEKDTAAAGIRAAKDEKHP